MNKTDEQAFLSLMKRFGLKPSNVSHGNYLENEGGNNWVLCAEEGGVQGYSGFKCSWHFDKEGEFTGVGVWE